MIGGAGTGELLHGRGGGESCHEDTGAATIGSPPEDTRNVVPLPKGIAILTRDEIAERYLARLPYGHIGIGDR